MFADLTQLPPSLIYVAENEIMYSDAYDFHQRLIESGCKSQFIKKAERWHA